jgi:chorismate lyase/3-hydroxybenzoate synthase
MDLTHALTHPTRPRRPAARPRRRPRAPGAFDLGPPPWVVRLFDGVPPREEQAPSAAVSGVTVTDSSAFTLVTARVRRASELDSAAFERRAADAYQAVADELRARPHRHAVRFWNHIPDIRRRDDAGHDRYMVFNAGRFAACSTWFGGPQTFDRLLPTASAVGHDGTDLVVHALAGNDPGVAVENPRQVPSYRYSRRFGPRPPCFARATVLPGADNEGPLILVAGTASIRGEETVHVGDVRGQTLETFENLAVLVESASAVVNRTPGASPARSTLARSALARSARGRSALAQAPPCRASPPRQSASGSFEVLTRFRDLRVYYVRPRDKAVIAGMVAAALPHLAGVEYVRADLCRPDLLVEIEGTAGVSPSALRPA